jgi:hypothetical protein
VSATVDKPAAALPALADPHPDDLLDDRLAEECFGFFDRAEGAQPPQSCRADPPQSCIELPRDDCPTPYRCDSSMDNSMGGCDELDSSMGGARDETAARLRALGIDTPPHKPKPFPCVLPGHDHEARVYSAGKVWWYRCDDLGRGVGLAEVRATIAYGEERHLSGVEAARWRERLDCEAGLREPIPLDVKLPEPCPKSARVLIEHMCLFVGLRDVRFPADEPFVFAYCFAQAYAGLSGDQVREGKDWLERAGAIRRAGEHGRSILWQIAGQDTRNSNATATIASGNGHGADEDVVRRVLAAFPGSELVGEPPPCPDPLRCEYRHRRAAGPWTCEANHPTGREQVRR